MSSIIRIKNILLLGLTFMLTSGCSHQIQQYSGTTPELKLEQFFNGPLEAHGMVQDRNGKVLRRFYVEMNGQWEGNKGTLEEFFTYDDGEKQTRIWHLEKTADNQYIGTADDVAKDAVGSTQGFALNWQYSLNIPVDGKTWAINFDDWMYLLDEQNLINRATMKKWGFSVGEVTLLIKKLEPQN